MITKSHAFIDPPWLCHLSVIETRHLKLNQIFICMLVLMFMRTYSVATQNVHFCKLCLENKLNITSVISMM